MSNLKRGDRRRLAIAADAARGVGFEDAPPGEHAPDELTGTAALDAMHDALIELTTPAGQHLSVKSIGVMKAMGKVLAHVTFTEGQTVTLRCSVNRAEQFYAALGKALGKS